MSWMQQLRSHDLEGPAKPKVTNSFAFRHEVKLLPGADATNVIFIEAAFPTYGKPGTMPFWEWRRHTFRDPGRGHNGRDFFRTFACGRGDRRGADCLACDMQFGPSKDKRVSIRNVRYWPVIALEHTFRIENDFGEVYYITPENRAHEREIQEKGGVPTFGRPGYIEVGKAHHTNLADIFERVDSMCVGCLEEEGAEPGKLSTIAYDCAACGNELENLETTRLSRNDWRQYGWKAQACGCGAKEIPVKRLSCSTCQQPRPAEIYDLVFPLVKTGSGKDTAINLEYGTQPVFVDEYEIGDGRYLMEGLDDNGNRVWAPEIAEKYSPLNFPELFATEMSHDYQKNSVFERS